MTILQKHFNNHSWKMVVFYHIWWNYMLSYINGIVHQSNCLVHWVYSSIQYHMEMDFGTVWIVWYQKMFLWHFSTHMQCINKIEIAHKYFRNKTLFMKYKYASWWPQILNIIGPQDSTMGWFWLSLKHPCTKFKKNDIPKRIRLRNCFIMFTI